MNPHGSVPARIKERVTRSETAIRILRILREEGPMSFKDLSKRLGDRVGSNIGLIILLGYGLVTRDGRKYRLTRMGETLINEMEE